MNEEKIIPAATKAPGASEASAAPAASATPAGRFKISPVSDSTKPSYLMKEKPVHNKDSSTDESDDENAVHVYKIVHDDLVEHRNLRPILKKPNSNSSFCSGGSQTDISAIQSVLVHTTHLNIIRIYLQYNQFWYILHI